MITQLLDAVSKLRLSAARAAIILFIGLLPAPLMAAPLTETQTFSILYTFTGASDGATPLAGLIQDSAGNLYGTTYFGGTSFAGAVFKVDTTGKETVLYNFSGGADGGYPLAALLIDKTGNLYGTTYYGGASNVGVVFKVDTSGTETVLYNFEGGTADGCYPAAGLITDKSGNFYGTTSACGADGYGTVYELTAAGQESILHSFAGGTSDGAFPYYGRLLMNAAGNFIGLTSYGGADGYGTLFQLTPAGSLKLLHSFAGGTKDGCYAYGTASMDKSGNFYGTTISCGSADYGTLWKVSSKGVGSLLHSFAGTAKDGAYPVAGITMDTSGNLYGDAQQGGATNNGVVYKVTSKGVLSLLHSFAGTDGSVPFGPVLRSAKGQLFGTTDVNGKKKSDAGTVWEIK